MRSSGMSAATAGCGSGVGASEPLNAQISPTISAPASAPPTHGEARCPTFAQQIGVRGLLVREPAAAHTSAGTSSGDSRHISASPSANTDATSAAL